MERALDTLSLKNQVRGDQNRDGYVYFGLTTSPTDCFPIKKVSANVRVLADYPVFTKMVPEREVHPFVLDEMRENADLTILFVSFPSKSSGNLKETVKIFTDREEYLGFEDFEKVIVPKNVLGAKLAARVHRGADLLTRALELSITHENNPFAPWVEEGFNMTFRTSKNLSIESLEKNFLHHNSPYHNSFPYRDLWKTRGSLGEGHPYANQLEEMKMWMASIPIIIPETVKRLNLVSFSGENESSFGERYYDSLS